MAATRSEILSCSPPMFSSRLLNSLIRTHPVVPLVLWGPVILALAVFGIRQVGLLTVIGLMAAGYLVRGPVHGVHHAHPNDRLWWADPACRVGCGLAATGVPEQRVVAGARCAGGHTYEVVRDLKHIHRGLVHPLLGVPGPDLITLTGKRKERTRDGAYRTGPAGQAAVPVVDHLPQGRSGRADPSLGGATRRGVGGPDTGRIRQSQAHPPHAGVQVAPCDVRGRARGPSVPGQARLLDPAKMREVQAAIGHKYGIVGRLVTLATRLRLGPSGVAGIAITIQDTDRDQQPRPETG